MKIIIVSLFFILALVMTFVVEAYIGAEHYLLANSSNCSIVLVGELRMLRADNTKDLISNKEGELASEFRFHEQYLESYLRWLFPTITQHSEKYMKRAVKYRFEFPYSISKFESQYAEFSSQINVGLDDIDKASKRVVEKYKLKDIIQGKSLGFGEAIFFFAKRLKKRPSSPIRFSQL